jgi:hypothetical protein
MRGRLDDFTLFSDSKIGENSHPEGGGSGSGEKTPAINVIEFTKSVFHGR